MLGNIITFQPSPNKAIVGANAFAHESGIHQHGMLANPLCYEIMTPALVGVAKTNLVLGKHSGRAALRHRLEELGFSLDRDELQHTYYRFVALADRKKNIYDQDLIGILPEDPLAAAHAGMHEEVKEQTNPRNKRLTTNCRKRDEAEGSCYSRRWNWPGSDHEAVAVLQEWPSWRA